MQATRLSDHERRALVLGLMASAGLAAGHAVAQPTFGLDDAPTAPILGFPGFGNGAEDPFGFVGALAPSPSLGTPPLAASTGDGAWLAPGPVVQHPGPNGSYVDSFSRAHRDTGNQTSLRFSVDRVTRGAPGTGVAAESGVGQAHGDIYTTTQLYRSPGIFAGTLPPGPFVGFLPSLAGGVPGNVLTTDESALGLLTPVGVVPPGVPVPPPFNAPGQHDNVDSLDSRLVDTNGDGLFDIDNYFTIYPDEAAFVGVQAADIFAVAAGDPGATPVPYAPAGSMGLTPNDSIDALIMFDNNLRPISTNLPGSPGFIEPVRDYALFSLAPGSASLGIFGLDAADVFFTDFTGAFAVYAPSPTMGLNPTPPGFPFQGEGVDALDLPARCPADLNGDGVLDNGDIQLFITAFLNGNLLADLNGDGILDNGDIQLFLQLFLAGCG